MPTSTVVEEEPVDGTCRTVPARRSEPLLSIYGWMEQKRLDDKAEGLWRVHDQVRPSSQPLDHLCGTYCRPYPLRLTIRSNITTLRAVC